MPLPSPVLTPVRAPQAPATSLDALAARVLQADDVPAFSRAMQELMAAIGGDDSSAQRLANVVLRDYALTVKVIRAANTAHYNRSGRAVQSATHALMLLGARTVRDLASALLLFEHYRRRSPGLKELMLLSLLTASTARATAEQCGAGVDPDAAYLAGMFRNLGEVLAAAHLPDEYAAALARLPGADGVRERPRSALALAAARASAARSALGCSYEDVGVLIARHWGMPDGVRHGMRAEGRPGEDLAAVCTAFAHDLTAAVHRGDEVHAPQEVLRLLAQYGQRLHLTRETLTQIAERAVEETREVFAAAGVRLDDLRLTRQVAAATLAARDVDSAPQPGAGTTSATPQPPAAPVAPGGTPVDAPNPTPEASAGLTLVDIRAQLATELAVAATDVTGHDLACVLLLALEAVLRGGPFDRAGFHAADPVAREFRPRTGLGDGTDRLLAGPGVPFDVGHGSAGPALRRGEEVHLVQGARLTLAESQLLRRWDAVSASLYPVRVGGAVIGCLHADRHTAFVAPEAATTQYVRAVACTLEEALERRRAAVTADASTGPVLPAIAPARPSP
ncbi:MAG: HDOD domain-containing protein, partial [Candidatus Eremiobacteraeota bacterium]|nr:HDOD domain-containing protein [Candidatus Eremiobacteraeota bacterium]